MDGKQYFEEEEENKSHLLGGTYTTNFDAQGSNQFSRHDCFIWLNIHVYQDFYCLLLSCLVSLVIT